MSLEVQVTFDCAEPDALARFWIEVLGYKYDDPPPGYATWDEALDAMNVPAERRNDASACHDPDGRGPAPVGSCTAEALLRWSSGTPRASRASSHVVKPGGGASSW